MDEIPSFHSNYSNNLDQLNEKNDKKKRKNSNDLTYCNLPAYNQSSVQNTGKISTANMPMNTKKTKNSLNSAGTMSNNNSNRLMNNIDTRVPCDFQKYSGNTKLSTGTLTYEEATFNELNNVYDTAGSNEEESDIESEMNTLEDDSIHLKNGNLTDKDAQMNSKLTKPRNSSTKKIKSQGDSKSSKSCSDSKASRNKKTKGRVKIKMEFIENKIRRYTTFSKRKTGIMKKAYELSTLTGTQVMLLVASETGHVYTFATDKLQPMITSEIGKNLIQSCLSYPQDEDASLSSNFENNGKISIENFNENDLELDDDYGSNNFDESDDQ